jgi:hypothetical protein
MKEYCISDRIREDVEGSGQRHIPRIYSCMLYQELNSLDMKKSRFMFMGQEEFTLIYEIRNICPENYGEHGHLGALQLVISSNSEELRI